MSVVQLRGFLNENLVAGVQFQIAVDVHPCNATSIIA